MFALAEHLHMDVREVEQWPVALFHEWCAYLKLKRERGKHASV